jgi:hypothetical protein
MSISSTVRMSSRVSAGSTTQCVWWVAESAAKAALGPSMLVAQRAAALIIHK